MEGVMNQPCKDCPYKRGVFFLRTERAEELAYHAQNPYNTFTCHKTLDCDDDYRVTNKSLECAGFLTLQINEGAHCPKGFIPSEDVYGDIYEMIEIYEMNKEEREEYVRIITTK